MRIDIMEYKSKNNRIKIILIAIFAVLLIAFFSIMGMYYAKMYKAKIISDNKEKISNELSSKKEDLDNMAEIEQIKNALMPIYSQKAKEEINNIYSKSSKIAYLTFDDGPSEAVTPLILDILKEENIKATFFVLGTNVKRSPEILKRAYLEGHYIANHGYSHNYSKIYKNAESVFEEYKKCEKQIQKAIGNTEYASHLFRFPGGFEGGKYEKIKKEAGKLLNKNDISYIDWNVLTGDAEGANTKEKILNNIKKHTKDKGNIVVLMHDSSSKILTYETLKEVIQYLKNEGYTFENFYKIMS